MTRSRSAGGQGHRLVPAPLLGLLPNRLLLGLLSGLLRAQLVHRRPQRGDVRPQADDRRARATGWDHERGGVPAQSTLVLERVAPRGARAHRELEHPAIRGQRPPHKAAVALEHQVVRPSRLGVGLLAVVPQLGLVPLHDAPRDRGGTGLHLDDQRLVAAGEHPNRRLRDHVERRPLHHAAHGVLAHRHRGELRAAAAVGRHHDTDAPALGAGALRLADQLDGDTGHGVAGLVADLHGDVGDREIEVQRLPVATRDRDAALEEPVGQRSGGALPLHADPEVPVRETREQEVPPLVDVGALPAGPGLHPGAGRRLAADPHGADNAAATGGLLRLDRVEQHMGVGARQDLDDLARTAPRPRLAVLEPGRRRSELADIGQGTHLPLAGLEAREAEGTVDVRLGQLRHEHTAERVAQLADRLRDDRLDLAGPPTVLRDGADQAPRLAQREPDDAAAAHRRARVAERVRRVAAVEPPRTLLQEVRDEHPLRVGLADEHGQPGQASAVALLELAPRGRIPVDAGGVHRLTLLVDDLEALLRGGRELDLLAVALGRLRQVEHTGAERVARRLDDHLVDALRQVLAQPGVLLLGVAAEVPLARDVGLEPRQVGGDVGDEQVELHLPERRTARPRHQAHLAALQGAQGDRHVVVPPVRPADLPGLTLLALVAQVERTAGQPAELELAVCADRHGLAEESGRSERHHATGRDADAGHGLAVGVHEPAGQDLTFAEGDLTDVLLLLRDDLDALRRRVHARLRDHHGRAPWHDPAHAEAAVLVGPRVAEREQLVVVLEPRRQVEHHVVRTLGDQPHPLGVEALDAELEQRPRQLRDANARAPDRRTRVVDHATGHDATFAEEHVADVDELPGRRGRLDRPQRRLVRLETDAEHHHRPAVHPAQQELAVLIRARRGPERQRRPHRLHADEVRDRRHERVEPELAELDLHARDRLAAARFHTSRPRIPLRAFR